MRNEMYFYLLSEMTNWNCSEYAYQYKSDLYSSQSFAILNANLIEAKKHYSAKAKNIVDRANSLTMQPKDVKDYFLTEIEIDYLALNSFPEYYINPLMIDPDYHGSLNTIGELMFEIKGNNLPLNEIIVDEKTPNDEKKEAISNQLDSYLNDMLNFTQETISKVSQRAFINEETPKQKIFEYISLVFFFLTLGEMFFIYAYPFTSIQDAMFSVDNTKISSFFMLSTMILFIIYLFVFFIYHSYRAKIGEPFNYARRFLSKRSDIIFKEQRKSRNQLQEYIDNAIDSKEPLKDDITSFSNFSTAYIDFDDVFSVDTLKKRKPYKVLHFLNNMFSIMMVSFLLILIIIYSVSLSLGHAI